MDISQIGMILEIVGFLVAALFAGILLERGVFGIWSGKAESWFSSTSKALDKFTFSWSRVGTTSLEIGIPGSEKLSALELKTFASILLTTIVSAIPLGAVICTIVGWLQDIPYVFWIGVSLFGVAFLTHLGIVWLEGKPLGLWSLLIEALPLMLLLPLISLILIPLCFSLSVLRTLQIIAVLLAGKDSLKKGFIIVGSIMVFAGLVLEFISTL